MRIGNAEYARAKALYELTMLHDRQGAVDGAALRFHFRGKNSKEHAMVVHNRRLATIVRHGQGLPGHELFLYLNQHGQVQGLTARDVTE
jgi:DNA topoisomerase-1